MNGRGTEMQSSVVVEHVEGAEWALVLAASRGEYGRRSITPMIFVNEGCGVFAVCPMTKAWIRAGYIFSYNPSVEMREALLKNAVQEFVRQVSLRSNILERSRVGIVARAKASPDRFCDPPKGFELNAATEPAFMWLFERSEVAQQAMRVARYLIEKHNLGHLTQAEIETIGGRLIRKGR
jgi:hypothetical protein